MPSFHHSVAVLPFRIAVARENGIAGNVFPYTYQVTRTLIGCPPTAERQRNGGNQALRNYGILGTKQGIRLK